MVSPMATTKPVAAKKRDSSDRVTADHIHHYTFRTFKMSKRPGTIEMPKQEVFVHRRFATVASLLILVGTFTACSTKSLPSDETSDAKAPHPSTRWFGKKEATIPAGTVITVRLANAVGSKLSNSGDQFNASVAAPVEVDGKVVIPSGAEASGRVVQAVPLGRFKGGAPLKLALYSVTINGDAYDVKTSSELAQAPQAQLTPATRK
jgi:hypothetical protein